MRRCREGVSRMNAGMRKLPIGVQNFEKLRTDKYLYIDKTKYIYELVHSGTQYFLSRPRRFGKSLFLSALRAYWEGKKELFEGLDIIRLEGDNPDAWQPYPVFYFDFNGKNYQVEGALENVLDEQLGKWEKTYGGDSSRSLEERFRNLLAAASEKYGKRCVVLVDEYDKSLLEVLHNEALEEHNKAVFKGFFGTLKRFDEYLQFVFLTGVTKFSKVSIFSDLNQLDDISMQQKYAAICGITEKELRGAFMPEVEEMADRQKLTAEECLGELRKVYDGYHFHYEGEGVYNPFSLLNALNAKEFNSYWFATGTPTFLVRKLRAIDFDVRKLTDRTLEANEAMLSDYRADNPDLVPLLYQTGYLTLVGYHRKGRVYTLAFPNEEVKYGFLESLLPEYTPDCRSGSGKDIFSLRRYVESGELEQLHEALAALFASITYAAKKAPFEHYFQTVIYLVFTLLGQMVQCEVHSARGRADCVVETPDYVYLFEFKLDASADEALAQIEEKQYAAPYGADKRKLFKVGVNFDSETRSLSEWKVREEKNN